MKTDTTKRREEERENTREIERKQHKKNKTHTGRKRERAAGNWMTDGGNGRSQSHSACCVFSNLEQLGRSVAIVVIAARVRHKLVAVTVRPQVSWVGGKETHSQTTRDTQSHNGPRLAFVASTTQNTAFSSVESMAHKE